MGEVGVRKELEKAKREWGWDQVKGDLEKLKVESGEVKNGLTKSLRDIMKEEQEKQDKEKKEGGDRSVVGRKEIRMEVVEEIEREKRRDKLVLMGVPEEGVDGGGEDIVRDVVQGLMAEVKIQYQVLGRVGKKIDGRMPRPVRIRVDDVAHRKKLLAKAKDLKHMDQFSKIYIVPDLTRVQQLEDKKIRDQVKKYRQEGEIGVRIERGKIVRGSRGGQVVHEDEVAMGSSGSSV